MNEVAGGHRPVEILPRRNGWDWQREVIWTSVCVLELSSANLGDVVMS